MRDVYRDGREYGQLYSWTPFPAGTKRSHPPASVVMDFSHPEMVRLSELFRDRGGYSKFSMWKGHKPATPAPYYAIYSRIGDCVSDAPETTIAAMQKVISSWKDPYREIIDCVGTGFLKSVVSRPRST